uniref:Uncharacterized protein n=1 Tax=Palpitomonas bilix TaxID=652834 RepID=A0A7S3LV51_9EUKA|mmetsp:Transcript_4885/g.10350  ORF Transcript_4885/g.10350 Transcript_4885/m.10350 type:complete len:103 (+) Transcript_4885:78-386(+)
MHARITPCLHSNTGANTHICTAQACSNEAALCIRVEYVAKSNANRSVEDSDIDPYRDIIISFVQVNAAVKRVMGEEIPTDIYIRVMKSLAVQRAGSWTFKGN